MGMRRTGMRDAAAEEVCVCVFGHVHACAVVCAFMFVRKKSKKRELKRYFFYYDYLILIFY